MLTPDNNSVIEFLLAYQPEGPWCLTGINPDRKEIETKTFTPETKADMLSWLTYYNGRWNLYFSTNRVNGLLKKKAEKGEIAWVDYLHVDVDPRPGHDIDAEQTRILDMFSEKGLLDRDMMRPTFLIFSGGGYQAFWKLQMPWPVDGDLKKIAEIERYNVQLERLFGGDSCHNVDRIMRLPGTINIPTEKKRKAGRVPVLSRLVREEPENEYPIENFQKAVVTKNDAPESDHAQRVENLNELDQWNISDTIKRIISEGRDEENPKPKDNSRSAWVWHVLMDLARHEVPARIMEGILLDPAWKISESILEIGRGAAKHAKEQVEKAIQNAISPDLVWMNERYFAVMVRGKFKIAYKEWEPVLERSTLTYTTNHDLDRQYLSREVQVGINKKNGQPIVERLVPWWMSHKKRRTYDGVVFAPNRVVADHYNLWEGWAVDSTPGDCSLFLDHCKNIICSGNEDHYNYLLHWMARLVQQPDKPGQVAVVMQGARGAGKGTFAQILGSLFGNHYMQVSNPSHLVGQFNSHLRSIILLFADEAFFANDKKHESVLKTLITEPTIPIEAKGIDVTIAPNMIHLLMASNDSHVIPAGAMERRYFVVEVSDKYADTEKPEAREYFAALKKQMEKGGREALLNYLMTLNIENFDVWRVPSSGELNTQKDLGLSATDAWWLNKLESGKILKGQSEWMEVVSAEQLQEDYYAEMQVTKTSRAATRVSLGIHLSKLAPHLRTTKRDITVPVITDGGFTEYQRRDRAPHYNFGSLDDCRKAWCKKFGPRTWTEE